MKHTKRKYNKTQDKKRRNILFYDLHEKTIMSRLDFVSLIRAGKYSRYCVRFSNGQSIPVARRDSSILNNLGLIWSGFPGQC